MPRDAPASDVASIPWDRDIKYFCARCVGPAESTFTWFRGYDWRMGACGSCSAHLGWRYEGESEPRIFFGLIRDALTTQAPGRSPPG